MNQNKISVIIPTFNRKELLAETLQSVIRQESPHWEAIVVNDGFDDGSQELVRTFSSKDPRIRFVQRDRHPKGAATCRNIGLLLARYDHVIFLDSDDLMEPHCIGNRLKAIEAHPGKDFLVFQIACFSVSASHPECYWNVDDKEDDIYRFLKLDSVWQTSSVVWKKNSVRALGGFDEKLHCWQDVDIHFRALMAGFKYEKFLDSLPDILYRRQNQASISQQQIHSREKLQSRQEILLKALYLADGRPWMIRELRWMAANIIASAANGHHFLAGYYLIIRSRMCRILKNNEMVDMLKLLLLKQFRLENINFGRRLRQNITDRMIWKTSVCKIPVNQTF